jgi:putative Mn2+ efflux pump MntP
MSLSLIGMQVWSPALLIGIAALVMTFVGTRLGKHAGIYFGGWAERIGGIVLIAIGTRILLQHLIQG